MIIDSLSSIKSESLFFHCKDLLNNAKVLIKLEGLNIAGSIKLKTAVYLINSLELRERITPRTAKIIESSSGNLGLALSQVCKDRGYHFTCVVDPNISVDAEKYMKIFGTEIIKVTEPDEFGGYLGTRIKKIEELIINDPSYKWTNQYASKANIEAHYNETAKEILGEIEFVDYLFIGAGTTGTLMGCAHYFRKYSPKTKIIAVDSIGSVTFGHPPKKRFIPGLGTSRKPEIVDKTIIDDVVMVDEKDAIAMCRHLLIKYGLFLGGSSGSVLHAVQNYSYSGKNLIVVALSPDFGHKYVETIYNIDWIKEKFLPEY